MKKGLLGFLTGTLLGGLTAMLTSKRSGKDMRKDLQSAWRDGKSGGKVVLDEVKDLAEELRTSIEEFSESEQGKKVKEQVVTSFNTVKDKVQNFLEDAGDEVEKVKKQVQKQLPSRSTSAKRTVSKKTAVKKKVPSKKKTTKTVAVKKA